MKRREFLKHAALTAAAVSQFPATLAGVERETPAGGLERRALGRTGEKLSIIGFGGLALWGATPEESARWVRTAIEAGVNYFDVAPSYGDADRLLGPALEPFRKQVFLSCKTAERGRAGAQRELEASLKTLRTDHLDLYQLHHVTTLAEVETIFSEDGAIKVFEAARKAGQVRFLGFSAHSVEAALALMARFEFDTLMFPVNYATWSAGNFGPQVLAQAREKKMGILALKAMARSAWPRGADRSAYPHCWYQPMAEPQEALLGLRFTLSHPVTAALTPGDLKCLKMALELAPKFTPLSETEAEAMKQKAQGVPLIFKYGAG